ncbi:MAG: threonylcarbamoyl-AMP synthase [Clostridiaceae bacterium]|nr:threonylcarbamoyl-AMP synthase [Clostridiaceae bacterium]
MTTIVQKINPEKFRDEELTSACKLLRQGEIVAFPTETVYGLGGNALVPEAAENIYAAKGRPSDNPLIVHIADREALYDIAEYVSEKAEALAKAYWPGPLTMIFRKKSKIPLSTTGGLQTVAVRMPSHPVARALIRLSDIYIAAPSANISGRPSPTKAEHVVEDLSGRIAMILDGGQVGIGIESTIVDMTEPVPMILRPGYVTKKMLEQVIGEVQTDPAILASEPAKHIVAKAPGMKYRHYAPRGQMYIVEGEQGKVVEVINHLAALREKEGQRAAVIASEETKNAYYCEHVYGIGSRKIEGSIAAGLYDILREMDKIGAAYIYAESFSDDRLGQAIMNRMLKAAGYQKIQAEGVRMR